MGAFAESYMVESYDEFTIVTIEEDGAFEQGLEIVDINKIELPEREVTIMTIEEALEQGF